MVVNMQRQTPRIRFSSDVLRRIEEECMAHPGEETGGILVGRKHPADESAWEIAAVIGAGPQAGHSPASFRPDVGYINRELSRLTSAEPGLAYLGGWHSHPGHMERPSGWDAEQARRILADPDYRSSFVIVAIATTRPFGIRAFLMPRHSLQLEEVTMEIESVTAESTHQRAVMIEAERLSAAGFTVRRRTVPGKASILEVPMGDDQAIVTAVLDAEFPRSRPQIMIQTLAPYPAGVTHLEEAIRVLRGQAAVSDADRAFSRIQALERRGLTARMVTASDGHAAFSLHRSRGSFAGFLTVQGRTGWATLYDRQQVPLALPADLTAEEWARRSAARLGVNSRHRIKELLKIITLAAVAVAGLYLAWLLSGQAPIIQAVLRAP